MSLGDLSKFAVAFETTFAETPSPTPVKLLEIKELDISEDKGYTDPETIRGTRTKAKPISTLRSVSGSFGINIAPENGFGELSVVTFGGYQHIEGSYIPLTLVLTASGGETDFTLTETPVVSDSELLFIKHSDGTISKLDKTAVTPDYSINDATGVVTLASALSAGDKVFAAYVKDVAGVHTHIFTTGDLGKSLFGKANKGNISCFDYPGIKIDGMEITLSAEEILTASYDIICKDMKKTSVGTFPAGLTLSQLDNFLFSQAAIYKDGVQDTEISSFTISLANNLEPKAYIACTDTIGKIFDTTQEITGSIEKDFEDTTFYDKFKSGEAFIFDIKIGQCNGVEIGNTGENYGLYFIFPNLLFTSDSVPVAPGLLVESIDYEAVYHNALGFAIMMVLVNSEGAYI